MGDEMNKEAEPSKAAKQALRDAVASWDEIIDELVWENHREDDPKDKPIELSRLEWFCKRFPHFEEDLRSYEQLWNSEPRITDEMLVAIEVKPEDTERTFRRTMQMINFYQKLRSVESKVECLLEAARVSLAYFQVEHPDYDIVKVLTAAIEKAEGRSSSHTE